MKYLFIKKQVTEKRQIIAVVVMKDMTYMSLMILKMYNHKS